MNAYRKGHLSVFLKMFITFLLIITPLYFINLFLNLSSRESIRREIRDSTVAKADFFMDGIEQEFNSVMLAELSLLNDPDLVKISTDNVFLQQYERNQTLLSIPKKLLAIQNLSPYVTDVCAYVPLAGKKISTGAITDLKDGEIDREETVTASGAYPFHTSDGKTTITLATSNRVVVDGRYRQAFVLSIEISRARLEETLRQITSYDDGGAILVRSGNGIDAGTAAGGLDGQLRGFAAGRAEAENAGAATLKMAGRNYIVVTKASRLLDTTLAVYIPEDRLFGTLSLYTYWIWGVTLATAAVIAVFALRMRRVVVLPLGRLVGAFRGLDEGRTDISVDYKSNDEFGYLYARFNDMVRRFGDLIRQVYEEKLRVKDAELKQLQYQINPHFLYNTIYIIYRMAKAGNLDGITELTLHLGNYYKFVSGSFNDPVPLENEWAHARDYVGIQSFRFSRRIRADLGELPSGAGELRVPRMILQPIIENVYKHGLKDKEEGGLLRIRFILNDRTLSAFVEDNGESVDSGKLGAMAAALEGGGEPAEGTGMLNVHRRLRIKYGPGSGLFLSRSGLGGLSVELRIEFDKEREDVSSAGRG